MPKMPRGVGPLNPGLHRNSAFETMPADTVAPCVNTAMEAGMGLKYAPFRSACRRGTRIADGLGYSFQGTTLARMACSPRALSALPRADAGGVHLPPSSSKLL